MFLASCPGATATIPPPESFEQIKSAADSIALVRVETVEATNAVPVKATVVQRFKGEPAHGVINIAWAESLSTKRGEKYWLNPKVGEVFYAFLKRNGMGAFSHASAQWSYYRVREAQKEEDNRGPKIYHHDCYWVLDGVSAVRFPYLRQPNVSKWPVEHTVKAGDSLWNLAEKYYGDHSRWKRIHESNGWITDPAKLQVGSKLSIPNISDCE